MEPRLYHAQVEIRIEWSPIGTADTFCRIDHQSAAYGAVGRRPETDIARRLSLPSVGFTYRFHGSIHFPSTGWPSGRNTNWRNYCLRDWVICDQRNAENKSCT